MKSLGLVLALCAVTSNAYAAPELTRAVKQGYDAGFHDCAGALDPLVKFVHDDDQIYAHFGRWSAERPNEETFSSLTSETYADGKGIASFTATKNAAGKCSITMTQVIVVADKICATLRTTVFKDWKDYGELNGDKIYEDPTTPNANLILTPIGQTGCLLLKSVVGFGIEPAKK